MNDLAIVGLIGLEREIQRKKIQKGTSELVNQEQGNISEHGGQFGNHFNEFCGYSVQGIKMGRHQSKT